MQQAESVSLDEIESFLDGCGSVEFQAGSRADKYALVEGVLKRHHYADQKRSVKGLLRRFLSKLTGLSRAQLTRLIGQFFWQLHLAHFGGLFWPPCKRASKSLISGHLLSFLGTWSGAEPEGRSAGRCPQKRAPSLLPPSLLLRQRPTKAVGLLARLDDVSAVGNAIQQRLT